jgi:hypothetical protein
MEIRMQHKPDEVREKGTSYEQATTEGIDLRRISALADETMLPYMLSAIEVRAKMIKQLLPADAPQQEIVSEVQRRLATFDQRCPSEGPSWRNLAWCEAYRLERLLALAEPDEKLVTELQLRLDEADEEQVPCAARLRESCKRTIALAIDDKGLRLPIPAEVVATLRAQLVNVIEETQWHLKKKYTARMIQRSATFRIMVAAVLSFGLFMSPYVVLVFKYLLEGPEFSVDNWVGLPVVTALTAGLFGAFFSRLLFIQGNWNTLSLDELKAAREYFSIYMRGIVGMCGAAVVYFFLHSHIIGGELFPDFAQLGLLRSKSDSTVSLQLIFPNPQLALLVVWSFLAGFSERLVPNILATTETTLSKASAEPRPAAK